MRNWRPGAGFNMNVSGWGSLDWASAGHGVPQTGWGLEKVIYLLIPLTVSSPNSSSALWARSGLKQNLGMTIVSGPRLAPPPPRPVSEGPPAAPLLGF